MSDLTDTGWADHRRFLRSWLADPMRVAAIAPSGRRLAQLITSEIGPETGPVLELGPGTGVFTRALLARGVREGDLTLIEAGEEFVGPLRARFPRARVIRADAGDLGPLASEARGAVVSGLPLLSMPEDKVRAILTGTFAGMRPGGGFYQFTYGPRCPVGAGILQSLGLTARRIGGTWINLPPAAVYRIERYVYDYKR